MERGEKRRLQRLIRCIKMARQKHDWRTTLEDFDRLRKNVKVNAGYRRILE